MHTSGLQMCCWQMADPTQNRSEAKQNVTAHLLQGQTHMAHAGGTAATTTTPQPRHSPTFGQLHIPADASHKQTDGTYMQTGQADQADRESTDNERKQGVEPATTYDFDYSQRGPSRVEAWSTH